MPVPENAFGAEITRHIQRRSLSGAIYCQEKPATSGPRGQVKCLVLDLEGWNWLVKGSKAF